MWAWLSKLLGTAGSTAASAPLMGIPGAVQSGAEAVHATVDGVREANRNATERAISKQKDDLDRVIDQAVDAHKKTKRITLPPAVALLALLALGALGCASAPSRDSAPSSGNVGRLIARPDFDAARDAAPGWIRDSLKTVNSLEADLQRERARANRVN